MSRRAGRFQQGEIDSACPDQSQTSRFLGYDRGTLVRVSSTVVDDKIDRVAELRANLRRRPGRLCSGDIGTGCRDRASDGPAEPSGSGVGRNSDADGSGFAGKP